MTLSWKESWNKLDWANTPDEELVRQVKKMLAKGADVNAKDEDGNTALMLAGYNGYTDTVKALVEAGADVNAKDKDGNTALMWAACEGHTDTIKALIEKGADVNAKDNDGVTVLMMASYNGYTDTVKALIELGADVNAKDKDGWTALMEAAAFGKTDTVKALIEAGADVNAEDDYGKTALMKAAAYGETDTVKALVEAGADLNAKDKGGRTAFDMANAEIKELLKNAEQIRKDYLEKQKDAQQRKQEQEKFENFCNTTDWNNISDEELVKQVEKFIAVDGMNVNSKDDRDITMLMRSVKGHPKTVKKLIQLGADVNATELGFNWTALSLAVAFGQDEIVQDLIDAGADLEAQTKNHNTAISWAAYIDNVKAAKRLLEAGCRVDVKGFHGETPLQKAKSDEMRQLIEQYMPDKTSTACKNMFFTKNGGR